jgi:hypothetical protein
VKRAEWLLAICIASLESAPCLYPLRLSLPIEGGERRGSPPIMKEIPVRYIPLLAHPGAVPVNTTSVKLFHGEWVLVTLAQSFRGGELGMEPRRVST